MDNKNPFSVYYASAGSGKTFSLVKAYLKIIIKSPFNDQFKNILAITFTNKAASEMKDRIISTLKEFADETILSNPTDMFKMICEELQMKPDAVNKKADILLNTIVYNYAFFDISTIDGFTHRIIRTFAHDLKLPLNFEVELDQESLLTEAIDSLIAKAGFEKELTKVLVDFALEKADDDKSWDVAFDFNKIAKILLNEDDIPFINKLKDKTFTDFKQFKSFIKQEITSAEKDIINIATNTLTLIEEAGLQFNDFTGSYIPKYFEKLSKLDLSVSYTPKWQIDIENNTLYPKRVTPDIASIIEEIQPNLAASFHKTKELFFHYKFLKSCYKTITPLSVLNAINNELATLKTEQNKVLISEFNNMISKEIKNQPTPFIYERLGEKFKHYFIDEFQDTSVLQWENLIPLIDTNLVQDPLNPNTGSLMVVGDAKQAIYRWRGGKAEQFIDLIKNKNPFQVKKDVINLSNNYRSYAEIINFNNTFFKYLSNTLFSNETYKELYQKAWQETIKEETGYVNLEFLDFTPEDDVYQCYSEKTYEAIKACQENGFQLSDICVLVRKNKQGVAIANYLSERDIKIISSESLLINNSLEVAFTIHVLKLILQPENNEVKIQVLNYLATAFQIEEKHTFYKNHIPLNLDQLFSSFKALGIEIEHKNLLQLSLYELIETIIQAFGLVKTSNAYIQYLLDVVFEYSQTKQSDLAGFLEYYEKKKHKLSIALPSGQNAVQIMTIHKSKGLEFPVVIFPFADLDIYKETEPKEWFPLNPDYFQGFSATLLNYNKDFEYFGETGNTIHIKRQAHLELDNMNLLYVALTRAEEQLYIISKKDITKKGEISNKTYAGLLINYLISLNTWNDNQLEYTFGHQKKVSKKEPEPIKTIEQTEFISTPKHEHQIKIVSRSGYLWDTLQEEAIEKGNLIHDIMAKINTKPDIDPVIDEFIRTHIINLEQAEVLKPLILKIVTHPELETYYSKNNTIYNERDILSKKGDIFRPDRLVINPKNEAIIIDYKTGSEDKKHSHQLNDYENVLLEMNIKTQKKILVYINDGIQIKEF